jgi:hypothetical protein
MTAIQKLLILAASANLLWQLRAMYFAFSSTKWKSVRGRLLKCYVGESNLSFSLGEGDCDDQEDGNHTANVLYTYRVAGTEFKSDRLTYQPTWGLLFSDAVEKLHGLTANRDVQVFYDPIYPSRSVIIPGASDDNAIRSALAILLLAAAVWVAI